MQKQLLELLSGIGPDLHVIFLRKCPIIFIQTVGSNDDYVNNEYSLYPTLFDETYAASDEGTCVLKDFYILGMLTAKIIG